MQSAAFWEDMEPPGFGTVLLVTLISLLVFYVTWGKLGKRRRLPPGPTPLPLLGNLLQVRNGEMAKTLMELSETYGSVYTFYFGPRPVVVFCGYEAVKEALIDHGEDFTGRGEQPTVDRVFQGYGLMASEGERWQQLRRFSLSTLRYFGLGKRSIEERITDEAECLVQELRTYNGQSIDPAILLSKAVSNAISAVVFGKRFEYDDTRFHRMLDIFTETFEHMSSIWGQEKNNPGSKFHMRKLLLTLNNLFFAGGETVATTLKHGFLVLLKHQDIQAKLHAEIDRVIGQNRRPTIEDRSKMPYMEAVIHEIQRFSGHPYEGVSYIMSAIKDTEFRAPGAGRPQILCHPPQIRLVHRFIFFRFDSVRFFGFLNFSIRLVSTDFCFVSVRLDSFFVYIFFRNIDRFSYFRVT
uniref:Uncharacterized protein n=1 Tax=Leptobrachium leishanense TaxID=445787 RepID=A0A8C5R9M1_9ANUR